MAITADRCLVSLSLGHRHGCDAGYPREEPGTGNLPARICEGEAEWLSYSTTIPLAPGRAEARPSQTVSQYCTRSARKRRHGPSMHRPWSHQARGEQLASEGQVDDATLCCFRLDCIASFETTQIVP